MSVYFSSVQLPRFVRDFSHSVERQQGSAADDGNTLQHCSPSACVVHRPGVDPDCSNWLSGLIARPPASLAAKLNAPNGRASNVRTYLGCVLAGCVLCSSTCGLWCIGRFRRGETRRGSTPSDCVHVQMYRLQHG